MTPWSERAARPFAPEHLLRALRDHSQECGDEERVAAGARVCVRAELAPHVPGAHALLALAGAGRLRLVPLRAPRAHEPLRLWFADCVRAAALLPHLAPHNIRGRRHYECVECGARFEEPNPLKLHLFLSCGAPEPARVWRALARRLAAGRAPAAGHPCAYCGRVYSRRYGLKIHERTHTGARPLRCRTCARAFADPSNLNKHERLHARRAAPRA